MNRIAFVLSRGNGRRVLGRSGVLASIVAILALTTAATAKLVMGRPFFAGGGGGAGSVSLPYTVQDTLGHQWLIYQYGQIQQNGNMPIYSQGAMLMVNGNQPTFTRSGARIVDEKTGEIAIENMNAQGSTFAITRRILVERETGIVRYIDILKNTGGAEQTANVMIQTTLNYGVNSAQNVGDLKKKGQDVAWVAQTGAGAAVAEVYCGKGSKSPMQILWQNGNNQVSASIQLTVAAGKEVAVMHLHSIQPTQDGAARWVQGLKESDLLKNVPREIRKLIVNFPSPQGFIGDLEILRGDMLDVVELSGGDQLKGTIKEPAYELSTFYGPVTVPVDRVIGLLNVGRFRPRQLVVTSDGQIFGGKLKKETLDLQLSSGQITQIPLSQVTRAGYRKRPGEVEEWTFEKPIVLMRTGERVGVQMPSLPIECMTRYGRLTLRPEQIASVIFQVEESGVHEIRLVDGSKFSGLLAADEFEMKLDAASPEQAVKFPVGAIARMQLSGKAAEVDENAPTLKLANDDMLVGTISGQLKIDTAFDTITLNASEVRGLTHVKESSIDVQLVLWDGSSVSGQLQDMNLPCQLAGGVLMKVPVALLLEYNQPQPQPSHDMEEKIKAVIKDLNSEDWKVRDRADASLVSMGTVAISTLKRLRAGEPPEAQKHISDILLELEKQKAKDTPKAAAGGTTATDPTLPNAAPQFQLDQ